MYIVNVLVVLPVIPEHSKASCFVLSELSLILKPLSSVTTELDVIEARPVIDVALPHRAIQEEPTVTDLFASGA